MVASILKPRKKLNRLLGVDTTKYDKHLKHLTRVLNLELVKYNVRLRVEFLPVEINNVITKFIDSDEFTDHVWPNQVETVAEIIHRCLENPGQHGVIIGSCQLGKTMTIILCQLLTVILFMLHGEKYRIVIMAPGKDNLRKQTIEDYRSFASLYNFSVSDGEDEVTLSEYRAQVLHLGPEEYDIPIVARTPGKSGKKLFLNQMERFKKERGEVKLICLVDEYHWGEKTNGIMDEMLNEGLGGDGNFMIAISATPWHLTGLDGLWKVCSRTYDGYVGYAFWRGELLDPRYKLRVPRHFGFDDEVFEMLDVSEFGFVCRNIYYNANNYKRKIDKDPVFAARWRGVSHSDYREFVERKLVELINACLVINNPLKRHGMAIRFFKRKDEVENFIERIGLLGLDPTVVPLAWQGEEARKHVGNFIRDNGVDIGPQKVVIFVTGHGRMGNRFDKYFGYFAEFAETSSLVAMMQGLVGRSCGNKADFSQPEGFDVPWVFLSPPMADRLTEFVKTKDVAETSGPLHETIRRTQRGRSTVQIFDSSFVELGLEDLYEFMQDFVSTELKGVQSLTRRKKPNHQYEDFWDVVFAEESLQSIENALGIPQNSLVRHCYDDESLQGQFLDINGHAYGNSVGFRTVGKDAFSGVKRSAELSSDRLADKTRKAQGIRFLVPQLHVEPIKKRGPGGVVRDWKLRCFKLQATRPDIRGRRLELPTYKSSAFHRFASSTERLL